MELGLDAELGRRVEKGAAPRAKARRQARE
jgi:hypothetical protein